MSQSYLEIKDLSKLIRKCPLCDGPPSGKTFPWSFHHGVQGYTLQECYFCKCAFVDPLPNEDTFSYIYAEANYHVCHYLDIELRNYYKSARLLGHFASNGSRVLDYGCGWGYFLKALHFEGFDSIGIEFSKDLASTAEIKSQCKVYSVADPSLQTLRGTFDVLYLGDVLEHLPYPGETLADLKSYLRPGGLLMVEGPLEINPSPVYWVSFAYGLFKRLMRPGFIGEGIPGHLFRASECQQRMFFERVLPLSDILYWRTYETGWPYSRGGFLKGIVARLALLIGGRSILGITFGNRFTTIIKVLD